MRALMFFHRARFMGWTLRWDWGNRSSAGSSRSAGAAGVVTALGLQWYTNAFDYPLITQGKPYFSWQAFVPVMFELMVLFGALGAVVGMFALNGLPQWYHPTLKHDRFAKATDDGYFLVIEGPGSGV